MSVGMLRGLAEGLRAPSSRLLPLAIQTPYVIQTRGYPTQKYYKIMAAARKRNLIRKMQKKDEVKLTFVEAQRAKLKKTVLGSRRYTEANWPKEINTDDVHFLSQIRRPCFDLETCIEMHREILHMDMYNKPNATLMATVELDMRARKKGRFIDQVSGSLLLPHFFEYKRQLTRILCFCKSAEEAALALEKGANLAGGEQLIKKIAAGEVDVASFDTVICHLNMHDAIQPLKNILKKQMPRLGDVGCISDDVLTLIERHRKALLYTARGDVYEPDYAAFTLPIATLQMPLNEIRDNVSTLFAEVNRQAPKYRGLDSFVTEVFISCPPSLEKFVLDRTSFCEALTQPQPLTQPVEAEVEAEVEERAE